MADWLVLNAIVDLIAHPLIADAAAIFLKDCHRATYESDALCIREICDGHRLCISEI